MKQIMQDLSNGITELIEAPAPRLRPGSVLIETSLSLISPGTERMLVDFARSGLVAKAMQQPEKVRQVLEKAKTDGVFATVDAVRSKLGQPIPLGYSNVGIVRESSVPDFVAGDRVLSNGPHADVVCVPRNLCAKIPATVGDEAASFTVVASVGLQGIRLAGPTIGEAFVVIGAGLIGLLTVQLLRAHGCRVLAIDLDDARLEQARSLGAVTCNPSKGDNPIAAGMDFSRGVGVDGVIITASTKSSDPVTQAARMSRKRGRIVLVGVTGLELNRADFYEKELTFQVSCSYGPGRYDPAYEERGQDYPVGFVRWTEQRNFEAVLDLLASGQLDVAGLVTHRIPFLQAAEAYDALTSDKNALGIVLTYKHGSEARHVAKVELTHADRRDPQAIQGGKAVVGFIGAGNYASRILIPAFRSANAQLHSIVSPSGTSAVLHGRRNGFAEASSQIDGLITDTRINTVAIVTRHDSHARLTARALSSGKHVFVEKPLALTIEQLDEVRAAYEGSQRLLMVGFNRRFAPLVQPMKQLMDKVREPKVLVMVMNAGSIPAEHWTQDEAIGGGRIIGEACHHMDLMRFLVGAPIVSVQTRRIGDAPSVPVAEDKAAIILGFADGSLGTIHYLANGGTSFPKERIEVFAAGRTMQLDNFIKLRGFNWPGLRQTSLWRQDKGQKACATAFLNAVEMGGPAPIPAAELFEVAKASIDAAQQLRAQARPT